MTHPSRTLAAALMLTLVLVSFSYGLVPVRAADASADAVASSTTSSDTSQSTASQADTTSQSSGSVDTSATASSTDTSDATTANTASTADASSTTELTATGTGSSASTTPDTAVLPDASSTPNAASMPFNAVTALLTGSSTASTTALTGSSTPVTSSTATATSTGPTIQSGQAVALANILNIVNTNLVNSSGNALLLNYVDPVTGTIDLRTGAPVFASSSPICALIACAGTGGVSVNLSSDANIQNAIVLNATSGGNLIDMGSTTGQASIDTGNAYAGLNLINLANTNIVDSNYLLVTMNAFQGVKGNIVFPSLSNLFSSLTNALSPNSVTMTSTGNVSNDVSTDAETGGNSTDASSSAISTGTADSSGSVFNQINANELGGSNVAILFRVQGNWAGQIFGAPSGLEWTQGPGGTIALFSADPSAGAGSGSLAQLTASSTANINNTVSVVALTGNNEIQNADSALITTGNALASANVLNVANTNVVGKNWIMAIINIFGDFTGNISFGEPDLWVGEQVSVPSYIQNGSQATYKFTVINNGDAPASNVALTDRFDTSHINVTSSSVAYTTDGSGNHVWNLGTIPAGGAVEVTYQGTVQNTSPGTNVSDTVSVSETEPDFNMSDNSDTATFTTSVPSSGGSSYRPLAIPPPVPVVATTTAPAHITVTRATPKAASTDGSPVHQQVTVENDSSAASIPLVVHDILTAPDGTQVYDESWDVGSLAAGDAVQLAYDANFSASAPSGTYTLSTVIDDEQGNQLGWFVGNGSVAVTNPSTSALRPLSAIATITHGTGNGNTAGSVLGAVFPGVAVAHAADAGDQAAAAGLVPLSWPYLVGIVLVLLGLLALLAKYRRRA